MSKKHFLSRARVDGLMDDRSSLNIVWGQRRRRNYRRVANVTVPDPLRVPLRGLSVEIMQYGFQRQHEQEGMRWGSRQRRTVNQQINDARGIRWGSKRRRTAIKTDAEQGERVHEETVTQNNSPLADLSLIEYRVQQMMEQHGKEGMRWGSKKRRTTINIQPEQQILKRERFNEKIWNQENDAAESLLMLKRS